MQARTLETFNPVYKMMGFPVDFNFSQLASHSSILPRLLLKVFSAMSSQTLQQISTLPQLTKFVTGHDEHGRSEIHESSAFTWSSYDDNKMGFSVAYTTSSSPAVLTNNADLEAHKQTMTKGLGLVNPKGSVVRCVDFAPGYSCSMHRTKSLDYGIVLEGEIEMVLDSGVSKLHRGDIAVQRATNHQWRNTSSTNWARMMFVLLDCETDMKEDLGEGVGGLLPSGN